MSGLFLSKKEEKKHLSLAEVWKKHLNVPMWNNVLLPEDTKV